MAKVEVDDRLKLIYFKPDRIVTVRSFLYYFAYMGQLKGQIGGFKKYSDLSDVEMIDLSSADLENISLSMDQPGKSTPARVAVYCQDERILHRAEYMSKIVLPEHFRFHFSNNKADCAEYLGISLDAIDSFKTD